MLMGALFDDAFTFSMELKYITVPIQWVHHQIYLKKVVRCKIGTHLNLSDSGTKPNPQVQSIFASLATSLVYDFTLHPIQKTASYLSLRGLFSRLTRLPRLMFHLLTQQSRQQPQILRGKIQQAMTRDFALLLQDSVLTSFVLLRFSPR